MLAETPLVKNLENIKFEKILLNGCADLSGRFVEIEASLVREKMRQATRETEKLNSAVKSLIKTPKLPDYLIGACILARTNHDQAIRRWNSGASAKRTKSAA